MYLPEYFSLMNPLRLATPAELMICKKNIQQLKHPMEYLKSDLQTCEHANCSN